MTQPYSYGGTPPQGAWSSDPQAPTIPPHVNPQAPKGRMTTNTAALIAAFLLALVLPALSILGYLPNSKSATTGISHLQHEVSTLQHQHEQDTRTIGVLQHQVATVTDQAKALSKQVGVMAPTVHNLAPFGNAVCPGLFQGSKGAFSASVPCRT